MNLSYLELQPNDLHFIGEGNDHLVFSLLGTGSVLRIKKTPAKQYNTPQNEFMLHLEKDLKFIHFSRHLVSPLLVNKAFPVAINPAVIDSVMKKISNHREGKRLDKQRNPFGIGILFVNATITFSTRRIPDIPYYCMFKPHSKTELVTSSSLSTFKTKIADNDIFSCSGVESYLEPSQEENENGSIQKSLSEGVLKYANGKNSRKQPVLDETPRKYKFQKLIQSNGCKNVDHSKSRTELSSDISITDFCDSPKTEYCDGKGKPASMALGENIFAITQEESLAFKVSNEPSDYIMKSGSRSRLPPKTICIELKPKQGYKELTPSGNKICRFCSKQFIKVQKGSEQSRSLYCPLDLFSGDRKKMKKSISDLFSTPQNNLRIFVEGAATKEFSKYRYLSELMIDILLYELFKQKKDLILSETNSQSDNLARSNSNIQKNSICFAKTPENTSQTNAFTTYVDILNPHCIDEQVVSKNFNDTRIYHKIFNDRSSTTRLSPLSVLGRILLLQSFSKIYEYEAAILIKTLKAETGIEDVAGKFLTDINDIFTQNFEDPSNKNCSKEVREKYENNRQAKKEDPYIDLLNKGFGKKSTDHDSRELGSSGELFKGDSSNFFDAVQSLQESLIALSVKDISLMILIQGPFDACAKSSAASPFWLEFQDEWYKCQVTVVDLALKCPSKILEHEKSIIQMEEILKNLEMKPSCCAASMKK